VLGGLFPLLPLLLLFAAIEGNANAIKSKTSTILRGVIMFFILVKIKLFN